jgi:hypothetical protein
MIQQSLTRSTIQKIIFRLFGRGCGVTDPTRKRWNEEDRTTGDEAGNEIKLKLLPGPKIR